VDGFQGYLKGSFLRSPLDLSISFASEQVVDELAHRCKLNPVEFRRRNLSDPRWHGVLDAVLAASKWQPSVAGERKSGDVVRGTGVALGTHFQSYGAAIAEVEVNKRTGEIRVLQLYGSMDPGLVVNPLSVEQQIEGQLIQATSRMLLEEVEFDERTVTSVDWSSYPILRFEEAPKVTAIVISRPDQISTGAGEEVLAAAGAAIANAFFDATGVRMRERPMRPDRVLAALKAG
jgi:nicotinate dehydrogenase subunit B